MVGIYFHANEISLTATPAEPFFSGSKFCERGNIMALFVLKLHGYQPVSWWGTRCYGDHFKEHRKKKFGSSTSHCWSVDQYGGNWPYSIASPSKRLLPRPTELMQRFWDARSIGISLICILMQAWAHQCGAIKYASESINKLTTHFDWWNLWFLIRSIPNKRWWEF